MPRLDLQKKEMLVTLGFLRTYQGVQWWKAVAKNNEILSFYIDIAIVCVKIPRVTETYDSRHT
jgi:hypothetical protein